MKEEGLALRDVLEELNPDKGALAQLERFVQIGLSILEGNLVGVYLHGSLALGCFNPLRSDLDLLLKIERGMSVEKKRELIEEVLPLSGSPYPLEFSVLTAEGLDPWQYPTPFDLHYSEDWREKYRRELSHGGWRDWNEETVKDPDLAAHIKMTRLRGYTLWGKPHWEALPSVSKEDYARSLLEDLRWIKEGGTDDPVYVILNLCRIYLYFAEGRVLSKEEGGRLAKGRFKRSFDRLIERALLVYRERGRVEQGFDRSSLKHFMEEIEEAILDLADV